MKRLFTHALGSATLALSLLLAPAASQATNYASWGALKSDIEAGLTTVTIDNNVTAGAGDTAISISQSITIRGSVPVIISTGNLNIRHFTITGPATVTLNNVTLDGNSTAGGIDVLGTSAVTIDSDGTGTISHCSAHYGGGINSAAPLTVDGVRIVNNTATGTNSEGGGIYALGGNTTITGATVIYGNSANTGGGVYQQGAGTTLHITGSAQIGGSGAGQGNTAGYGGGIYVSGRATDSPRPGLLVDGDAVVQYNESNISGGGGIYVADGGDVTIAGNASIDHNTAVGGGGGLDMINSAAATVTIKDNAAIVYNTATSGGGVVAGISKLIMSGGTVSNNIASGNGGGISAGSTVTMTGGTVSNNTASGNGGGISASGASVVTLSGSALIDNNTAVNGGGVYMATDTTTGAAGSLAIEDNATVTGNKATNGNGGGVYSNGPTITVTATGTSAAGYPLIGNNTASDSGGGAYTGSYTTPGGVTTYGVIALSGGTVLNNIAGTNGGGIYASDAAALSGSALIDGNTATGGDGGGVYMNSTTATLAIEDNATVTGNKTTNGNGGGVYSNGPVTVTATGTSAAGYPLIDYNTAGIAGGGIYAGSAFTMSGGEVSNNTAGTNGGGILANYTITMSDGMVQKNHAANGGGIYAYGAVTMSDSTVQENLAAATGGGLYAFGAVSITGSTVSNNTAATDGGGIYAATGAIVALTDAAITNNTATAGVGGGVYVQALTQLTTGTGVTFSGNHASKTYPWFLSDPWMAAYRLVYITQINPGTTHTPITGSDNIYNQYDVNMSADDSAQPTIGDIDYGDSTVSGTSTAADGTVVTVTFPDGSTATAIVSGGAWTATIPPPPGTTKPVVGDNLIATQEATGMNPSSPVIGNVIKVPGEPVSGPPTQNGTPTIDRITVNAVTNAGIRDQEQDVVYAISTSNTATPGSLTWQSGTTFTGLSHNTTYYVYARTADDGNHYDGPMQMSGPIITIVLISPPGTAAPIPTLNETALALLTLLLLAGAAITQRRNVSRR